MVRSRRALEQVPSGHYEWRPHDKSMSLGNLAELVAIMPRWVSSMVTANELDVAPTSPAPSKKLHTSSELLSALRDAAASARDALMNVTDTQLDETFELKARDDRIQTCDPLNPMRVGYKQVDTETRKSLSCNDSDFVRT